jgi:hypothetical protein
MTSKLIKYSADNAEYGRIDFFYSPDMKEDIELHDETALDIVAWTTIDAFLGMNQEYNKIVEANAKKNNLEKIAILAAHGQDKNNKWVYFVNEEAKSMQRWISSMDGKYKAIILYSCNPGRNEVYTRKTPIIAPNETFSHKLLNQGKVQIELVMPGTGHVDSYMLEEELRKLEK